MQQLYSLGPVVGSLFLARVMPSGEQGTSLRPSKQPRPAFDPRTSSPLCRTPGTRCPRPGQGTRPAAPGPTGPAPNPVRGAGASPRRPERRDVLRPRPAERSRHRRRPTGHPDVGEPAVAAARPGRRPATCPNCPTSRSRICSTTTPSGAGSTDAGTSGGGRVRARRPPHHPDRDADRRRRTGRGRRPGRLRGDPRRSRTICSKGSPSRRTNPTPARRASGWSGTTPAVPSATCPTGATRAVRSRSTRPRVGSRSSPPPPRSPRSPSRHSQRARPPRLTSSRRPGNCSA